MNNNENNDTSNNDLNPITENINIRNTVHRLFRINPNSNPNPNPNPLNNIVEPNEYEFIFFTNNNVVRPQFPNTVHSLFRINRPTNNIERPQSLLSINDITWQDELQSINTATSLINNVLTQLRNEYIENNNLTEFINSTLQQKAKYKKVASKEGLEEIQNIGFKKADNHPYTNCPIYCYEFEDNEIIAKLPCGHYFSREGIDTWLKDSNICPICRHELPFIEKDRENEDDRENEEDRENALNYNFAFNTEEDFYIQEAILLSLSTQNNQSSSNNE